MCRGTKQAGERTETLDDGKTITPGKECRAVLCLVPLICLPLLVELLAGGRQKATRVTQLRELPAIAATGGYCFLASKPRFAGQEKPSSTRKSKLNSGHRELLRMIPYAGHDLLDARQACQQRSSP